MTFPEHGSHFDLIMRMYRPGEPDSYIFRLLLFIVCSQILLAICASLKSLSLSSKPCFMVTDKALSMHSYNLMLMSYHSYSQMCNS